MGPHLGLADQWCICKDVAGVGSGGGKEVHLGEVKKAYNMVWVLMIQNSIHVNSCIIHPNCEEINLKWNFKMTVSLKGSATGSPHSHSPETRKYCQPCMVVSLPGFNTVLKLLHCVILGKSGHTTIRTATSMEWTCNNPSPFSGLWKWLPHVRCLAQGSKQ